jgi:TrmH family RNA methyltransferase
MITIRKLLSLEEKTRIRNIENIVQEFERATASGSISHIRYFIDVLSVLREIRGLPRWLYPVVDELMGELRKLAGGNLGEDLAGTELRGTEARMFRLCNAVRHGVLQYLQEEPADWDLHIPITSAHETRTPRTLPLQLYLEDIRSPFNLGSIFRTAEAFGVERLLLSPQCPNPDHHRAQRAAMGCTYLVPWMRLPIEKLAPMKGVFALELGGTPIDSFHFPPSGIAIIGTEELGVSEEALAIAENSYGRVSIPLIGAKQSLNVSVSCGILLHRWTRDILGS